MLNEATCSTSEETKRSRVSGSCAGHGLTIRDISNKIILMLARLGKLIWAWLHRIFEMGQHFLWRIRFAIWRTLGHSITPVLLSGACSLGYFCTTETSTSYLEATFGVHMETEADEDTYCQVYGRLLTVNCYSKNLSLLHNLHWFHICFQIQFNFGDITCKVLNILGPEYSKYKPFSDDNAHQLAKGCNYPFSSQKPEETGLFWALAEKQ